MPTSTAPQRKTIPGLLLLVLFLLGLSVFINYVDRGNLSIAAPMLKDELGISASQLGVLLSAFFWTYACLQPFAGWLVDRWNVNWVFAGGFFLWSAATATTGFVHTFAVLLVLRLLLGIGESVAFPSYSKIIALNFVEEHRGFANSVVSAGFVLGPGFGMLFGGLLMARFGWRPFFLVLGLVSLLWLVPWLKWMPKPTPKIPDAIPTGPTGAPGLLEFLRLRSAWGTSIGLFCSNYVNYFLITWLPFYLVRERHFSMDNMARIGGSAYLRSDRPGAPASGSSAATMSTISSLPGFLFIWCANGISPWTTWPGSEAALTCWGPVSPRSPVGFPIAGSCRVRLPRVSARLLRAGGSRAPGYSPGWLWSAGRAIALPRSYWA